MFPQRIATVEFLYPESDTADYGGVQSLDHCDFLPGIFSRGLRQPRSRSTKKEYEYGRLKAEGWGQKSA
jgi:hypothetical protein